jgi:pantothenate kinase
MICKNGMNMKNLNYLWSKFVLEIVYTLKIDKIIEYLNKFIKEITKC